MEVTVKIPDQLAADAKAHGVPVDVYVEQLLAQRSRESAGQERPSSVGAAIDRILELRKGNTLAGLRIRDLIHEGHKY